MRLPGRGTRLLDLHFWRRLLLGEVSRPIKPNAVIADIDDQTKQQVLGYRVAPQGNRYLGTLGVFLIGRETKITF